MPKKFIISILFFCLVYTIFMGHLIYQSRGPKRGRYLKRIFEPNLSTIEYIRINMEYSSDFEFMKNGDCIEVIDPDEIKEFFRITGDSYKISPNHPSHKYELSIWFEDNEGSLGFRCGSTRKHGFMIHISSKVTSGLHYGYYRNDDLEPYILSLITEQQRENKSVHIKSKTRAVYFQE